jgi:3-oxoacyl-[acyl-carrier-protein] synthase-3
VQTAAALLAATSGWRLAVVVSAEQFSRRSRPGTRSALVVGDAAGAAVLERRPGTAGLLDSVLHATGADADVCVIGEEDGWMRTDRKVVDLAVGTQKAAVMELLARNDLTLDDIDFVVPHPGTEQVRSLLRERLGLPEHRYLTNFATCGNTASAAIPATVSEHAAAGLLRPGHLLLAPTAGAGWYSGGLLFRWWA